MALNLETIRKVCVMKAQISTWHQV